MNIEKNSNYQEAIQLCESSMLLKELNLNKGKISLVYIPMKVYDAGGRKSTLGRSYAILSNEDKQVEIIGLEPKAPLLNYKYNKGESSLHSQNLIPYEDILEISKVNDLTKHLSDISVLTNNIEKWLSGENIKLKKSFAWSRFSNNTPLLEDELTMLEANGELKYSYKNPKDRMPFDIVESDSNTEISSKLKVNVDSDSIEGDIAYAVNIYEKMKLDHYNRVLNRIFEYGKYGNKRIDLNSFNEQKSMLKLLSHMFEYKGDAKRNRLDFLRRINFSTHVYDKLGNHIFECAMEEAENNRSIVKFLSKTFNTPLLTPKEFKSFISRLESDNNSLPMKFLLKYERLPLMHQDVSPDEIYKKIKEVPYFENYLMKVLAHKNVGKELDWIKPKTINSKLDAIKNNNEKINSLIEYSHILGLMLNTIEYNKLYKSSPSLFYTINGQVKHFYGISENEGDVYDLINQNLTSYPELIKKSTELHKAMNKIYLETMQTKVEAEWEPSISEDYIENGYKIIPLYKSRDIIDEGFAQSHCVATYLKPAMVGNTFIFSIRDSNNNRVSTLEIKPTQNVEEYEIKQNYGKGNANVEDHIKSLGESFLDKINRKIIPFQSNTGYIKGIDGDGLTEALIYHGIDFTDDEKVEAIKNYLKVYEVSCLKITDKEEEFVYEN